MRHHLYTRMNLLFFLQLVLISIVNGVESPHKFYLCKSSSFRVSNAKRFAQTLVNERMQKLDDGEEFIKVYRGTRFDMMRKFSPPFYYKVLKPATSYKGFRKRKFEVMVLIDRKNQFVTVVERSRGNFYFQCKLGRRPKWQYLRRLTNRFSRRPQ
ncbi:BgTH12-04433 [Blumeria graminis f. sp. triticale]|uniref:BgTH12-04433 n=1 Tax=Blumeria graminis f. sp. triticale TaxID=1689686 RepID=A0A9W4GBZ6_BLUGR|nr:BgTH12-04433 [Blumeria graminis f. sp. triticale]